ncbi:MAG: 30S ribosomal protein S17 [Desulfurococcus sp.]|jgi:small subunit ribosomal protein S17|uniref:30S ribosomal protein S17 n=1 Tax=Desulfurococcus sp. TaxID=51678 RepID=UPI0031645FAF
MSQSRVNNIGVTGINPPEKTCNDPKCPWHGRLKVRGVILTGVVAKKKMQRTVVVRHEYLHYVKKYMRYEKRHRNIHAHLPPCIDVKEGDTVVIGETRPLAKTVAFVVLGVIKRGGE